MVRRRPLARRLDEPALQWRERHLRSLQVPGRGLTDRFVNELGDDSDHGREIVTQLRVRRFESGAKIPIP